MHGFSWNDLPSFASRLYREKLPITEQAIGILWFRFHCSDVAKQGMSATELSKQMDTLHLCNQQAAHQEVYGLVSKSDFVVMDRAKGGYIINFRERSTLDQKYGCLISLPPDIEISNLLITPIEVVESDSFGPLFTQLVRQANACYEYDFPDACALVCRRMVELLLIKAFEAHAQLPAIKDASGNFLGLGAVIGQAKSGKYFSLDKDTKTLIESVHKSGNDAAHCRFYAIKKKDIDGYKTLFDKSLSELLDRAKVKRK